MAGKGRGLAATLRKAQSNRRAGYQSAQEASQSDLAKQAQNPIANMISLPFQNNTNLNIGPMG